MRTIGSGVNDGRLRKSLGHSGRSGTGRRQPGCCTLLLHRFLVDQLLRIASVSSLKERGRVKRGFTGLLSGFQPVAGMPDWPAGLVAWGRGVPCSLIAAGPVERPVRVKDRAEPGRRSRHRRRPGRGGPRSDNRAAGNRRVRLRVRAPWAAPVLARLAAVIPSGGPAARGRGAWGWSARAAGSIRRTAAPRGRRARHGSDHALPAAGPAHPASCSAAGVSSALTCPSRIA